VNLRIVECEGAPRDLGLDQGVACGDALRAWIAARPARSEGPADRTLRRDVRRHFPQLAERIEGLARGARVPEVELGRGLAGPLGAPPVEAAPRAPLALGIDAAYAAGAPVLAFAASAFDTDWLVRRSRPENGLASLELATPWSVGALAGVNEAGLAVACVPLASPQPGDACHAPAFLLVQDCLQRFQGVDGATDWCRHRPAGGRAHILLADASGRLGGIEVAAGHRTPLTLEEGFVAAAHAGPDPVVVVVLDTRERCLRIARPGQPVAILR